MSFYLLISCEISRIICSLFPSGTCFAIMIRSFCMCRSKCRSPGEEWVRCSAVSFCCWWRSQYSNHPAHCLFLCPARRFQLPCPPATSWLHKLRLHFLIHQYGCRADQWVIISCFCTASNQHVLFTCHAPLHTSYRYKSPCSWCFDIDDVAVHMFSSIRCPQLMAQRKQFSSQHPSSERPRAAPHSSSSHSPVLWVTRTTSNYHHCLFYSHHSMFLFVCLGQGQSTMSWHSSRPYPPIQVRNETHCIPIHWTYNSVWNTN